jgi:glycosyltransferase involved in cell wall biosynthesis
MDSPIMVSIGMPVYNAEKYLRSAIDSVLCQTYPFFELIIADDASTDGSIAIIESFDDSRIKLLKNNDHKGISFRLNQIIQKAQGQYFARMDADDLMFPNRLLIQLNFLYKNQFLDVVGSQAVIVDENNTILGIRNVKNDVLLRDLFLGSLFIHPSIMGKTIWFKHHLYNEKFDGAEDFELFIRAFYESSYMNLEEPLIFYREKFNIKVYLHRLNKVLLTVNSNKHKINSTFFLQKLRIIICFKSFIIRILVGLSLEQLFVTTRNNKLSTSSINIYKKLLVQGSK